MAIPLLKELAQHAYTSKFLALMDVGEALVKYSAAITFAAAMSASSPAANEVLEMFKQAPTLGKLVHGIRRVLDVAPQLEWPLAVVHSAFRRENNKPTSTARYLLDEFIRLRNDERGHGALQPEGYYESLYLKNYLVIQDCVRACKHAQLSLLHIGGIDHKKGQYAYRATLLMGASPIGMHEPVISPSKVPVGATCLWDGGINLLPVDDFVTYRYCLACASEHMFFVERISEGKSYLHSYVGNHRMVIDVGDR